ncbi:MAG TPA: class I SAM-dependent methyltransferase [Micromonosporaceae bacterium]|nr:class I SAM-dependent methyltransferase [Micromonosporaceae bacterium]
MPQARYDAVADFYATGWADSCDDPASAALLELAGPVDGLAVLDVACGHGRLTRQLCRRGGRTLGVDISARLVAKARDAERDAPLGARYLVADASRAGAALADAAYDVATCCFGLSDIDDLDGALATVARALRPGGRFVLCVLHPCFPGAGEVSGSWPADGSYHDERWWAAGGALSTLRRQVGANHRTLSTYLNALRRHDLWVDAVAEPEPPAGWVATRAEAARYPVFLVVRCRRR